MSTNSETLRLAWDEGYRAGQRDQMMAVVDQPPTRNPWRMCPECDTVTQGSHRIWCAANALVTDERTEK